MVGWSWLIAEHAFISVAAGVSAGHEIGTESTRAAFAFTMPMTMTSDVGRTDISGEGYLRSALCSTRARLARRDGEPQLGRAPIRAGVHDVVAADELAEHERGAEREVLG